MYRRFLLSKGELIAFNYIKIKIMDVAIREYTGIESQKRKEVLFLNNNFKI